MIAVAMTTLNPGLPKAMKTSSILSQRPIIFDKMLNNAKCHVYAITYTLNMNNTLYPNYLA